MYMLWLLIASFPIFLSAIYTSASPNSTTEDAMALTLASLRAERMANAVQIRYAAVRICFSYSYAVGEMLLRC